MEQKEPEAQAYLDKKGTKFRRSRSTSIKRRNRPLNRFEMEQEKASTSQSAKKLKTGQDIDVTVCANFGYRILNFATVFSAISNVVKCKKCNGDVEFMESSIRGLGFKLVISCNSCEPTSVDSSPLINNKAYDINKRIVFAFRLLGIGLRGIEKFCGIMDLPKMIYHSFYDTVIENICTAAESVCNVSMENAVKEEQKLTTEMGKGPGLTVSGDGTWRKRGFSSHYGVSTIIGHYSGKVIDLIIKSSYCKACEYWSKTLGTVEYELWKENHEEECSNNHEGSSGKMEVDSIIEMFSRSIQKYNVCYTNYIGDGDSKTYKAIVDANPYEEKVIKKECIGHVQKRMGTRLRNVKKANKGLGGRGNLTDKLINELTVYYGLAIRRSSHSKDEMKKAIWATFKHKISTNEEPQHDYCPPGEDSWCSWQKSKAIGTLDEYQHKIPLPLIVQDAIRPIYEDLSSDELLKRCEGGFTQNSNESPNSVIWSMAPKTNSNGAEIVKIASYVAASTFNDGYKSILLIMNVLQLKIGDRCYGLCTEIDKQRCDTAEIRAQKSTKEARQARRSSQRQAQDAHTAAEGTLYGPGIAD
ncbi:PREDICTED: uncharacterized protein LOC105557195 [Vollenhovia emeryi]|uniref:uncharacterized protein LOC105557195 n=1 Tax=Vollenhovia emeryi TaxID=411798 RepID=UPI0005F51D36|nr:PREDICTED: uncharacterized protein LOC105557195 [Vollenhovia emeryi]